MPKFPDKSIDLIILDPPYNKNIQNWDNINRYIEWMGFVFKECERLLKNSGSLYLFHNVPETIFELGIWIKNNTLFIFKQFIVWNKKFKGCKKEGFLQGIIEGRGSRNYLQMAEYVLFYTFQDETGLTTVKLDLNNFTSLRQYFKDYQEALGISKKQIIDLIGQRADHCFRWGSSQWDIPTKETYAALSVLPLKHEFVRCEYEDLRCEYEDLRCEYEDLRREYEDLRYKFNNQKTHHSVWNYDIVEKTWHYTPKPVELIKNIILHSSNEDDIILDPFLGSGTTAIACKNLNRKYIGIEINPKYVELVKTRKIHSSLSTPTSLEREGPIDLPPKQKEVKE